MHLTIDELLAYTDEERAKWENWFTAHGNESRSNSLCRWMFIRRSGVDTSLLLAELFYAYWMSGDMLTEGRMKSLNESIAADQADQVFAFGHSPARQCARRRVLLRKRLGSNVRCRDARVSTRGTWGESTLFPVGGIPAGYILCLPFSNRVQSDLIYG